MLTDLPGQDREWLHLLVGDWQLIADLSFADLILWVQARTEDDDTEGWVAVAHVRVVRAPSVHHEADRRVREEAFPVTRAGRPIAVVTRHTNLGGRTPTRLELTYVSIGDSLVRMVAEGDFPTLSPTSG